MVENKPESKRLFFALWPDDQVRHQIDRACEQLPARLKARLVPAVNFHLTLLFLGSIPVQNLKQITTVGDSIQAKPMTLMFDLLGCWSSSKVAWLGMTTENKRLQLLAAKLRSTIQSETQNIPASRLKTKQFKAHITVARKCNRAFTPIHIDPIVWHVTQFYLVESRTLQAGAVYTKLQQWNL